MIVDLAVVDEPEATVFVRHRLVRSRRKIDDREPAKSQAGASVRRQPLPGSVRSPVRHLVPHRAEHRGINTAPMWDQRELADDAAHALAPTSGPERRAGLAWMYLDSGGPPHRAFEHSWGTRGDATR